MGIELISLLSEEALNEAQLADEKKATIDQSCSEQSGDERGSSESEPSRDAIVGKEQTKEAGMSEESQKASQTANEKATG